MRTHTRPPSVDGKQGARFERAGMFPQSRDNSGSDPLGQDVLSSHLDDARSIGSARRQNRTEIEIVREDDVVVKLSPFEDFPIRRGGRSGLAPVPCFDSLLFEEPHPLGRQIHVDKDLHAAVRGTSTSSARQAA